MESNRLIPVVSGLIILIYSLTSYQTQPHHMMMYGRVDYSIYIYLIIGVVLVAIPFLEQYMRSNLKSGKETDLTSAKGYLEGLESELKSSSREEIIVEESETKRELEERLKLAQKLLNTDEFKILKIIVDNEGITQDSIHFKTGFSHSKISMIMKKLEESDLIIRERFGKTYKLYLSEWFKNQK